MSAIVSVAEMREVEDRTIRRGIPAAELMRRAGESIASWVDSRVQRPEQRRVVALVGRGNNGGDALVTLALLHERGWQCQAILFGRKAFGDLPVDGDSLAAIAISDLGSLGHADVVLDGIFGIGSRPVLPESLKRAFVVAHEVRMSRGTPLIAIDVPSGVDASTGTADDGSFRADITLCLSHIKRGLLLEPAATFAGELELVPIGMDAAPSLHREWLITEAEVKSLIPRRRATAHKRDTGSVLVIGGAEQYYGAPRLAAEAAMRSGAGLVAVAVPQNIVPVVATQIPETVFIGLSDDPAQRIETIESFVIERGSSIRSIVVGPGLGRGANADAVMQHLFGSQSSSAIWNMDHTPTFVIDADALNWLSGQPHWHTLIRPGTAVMTPHAGEMSRLRRIDINAVIREPFDVARESATLWNQHVVLKAGVTSVASPENRISIAPRATPELATAGTGDVLAGLIGGLLAQQMSPRAAAISAVWIGAMAGRLASDKQSVHSVLATDVIGSIASIMMRLTAPRWIES